MTEIESYLQTNGIAVDDDAYEVTPGVALSIAHYYGYQALRPESCITLTTERGTTIDVLQGTVH